MLNYNGWTNKRTFVMARTIENSEAHFNEVKSIFEKFPSDDFRSLVMHIAFRHLKLDSGFIDLDENVNWEEITEHLKGKV